MTLEYIAYGEMYVVTVYLISNLMFDRSVSFRRETEGNLRDEEIDLSKIDFRIVSW